MYSSIKLRKLKLDKLSNISINYIMNQILISYMVYGNRRFKAMSTKDPPEIGWLFLALQRRLIASLCFGHALWNPTFALTFIGNKFTHWFLWHRNIKPRNGFVNFSSEKALLVLVFCYRIILNQHIVRYNECTSHKEPLKIL